MKKSLKRIITLTLSLLLVMSCVIVKAESLQAKDAAQILAIVYETTGISPEKVSIINK